MALFSTHYYYNYAWIPIFTAFIWVSTVLALLITWLATGRPHYSTMWNRSIPSVSDIGADILKPLFVVGCSITGVGFFLCLVIERWLTHNGRLVPAMRKREHVFATLATLSSFIGGVALINLAVFDNNRYPSLHRILLFIFILGVVISAIFSVIEYRWLSRDYKDVQKLQFAYITKTVIATALIVLALAFVIGIHTKVDVGAVFEWIIAIGYTFYLLTFWYDLRPSKGVNKGDTEKPSTLRGGVGDAEKPPNLRGGVPEANHALQPSTPRLKEKPSALRGAVGDTEKPSTLRGGVGDAEKPSNLRGGVREANHALQPSTPRLKCYL